MAEAADSPHSSSAKTGQKQVIRFQRKLSITTPVHIIEVVEKYKFLGD